MPIVPLNTKLDKNNCFKENFEYQINKFPFQNNSEINPFIVDKKFLIFAEIITSPHEYIIYPH